jgi:hypothetical protein
MAFLEVQIHNHPEGINYEPKGGGLGIEEEDKGSWKRIKNKTNRQIPY